MNSVLVKNIEKDPKKAILARANVDKCEDLVHEFKVKAIPHVILVHNKKRVTKIEGMENGAEQFT